jgi:hypothetical protein
MLRFMLRNGQALSHSGKPIPNQHPPKLFSGRRGADNKITVNLTDGALTS